MNLVNHAVLDLWLLFAIGALLHILWLAHNSVLAKHSASLRDFFVRSWVPLLVRTALEAWLFWGWWQHGDLATQALAHYGVSLNLTIPLNGFTAFGFGYLGDFALTLISSKVPWLKGQIPDAPNGGAAQ